MVDGDRLGQFITVGCVETHLPKKRFFKGASRRTLQKTRKGDKEGRLGGKKTA
jgi:hypothetical protein